MRIERIRGVNLTGLGSIDWTLPQGPAAIFLEDGGSQEIHNFLLEFFYAYQNNSLPIFDNRQGLKEVWMSGDHLRYHIRQTFTEKNVVEEDSSKWLIEDENGKSISLPKTVKLGEYFFDSDIRSFQLGGIVAWPNSSEEDNFSRLVRNLRHGGDEKLFLAKVRASITGAQKRVHEQAESMALVKAEYDTLRRDWEIAHRQQEEVRLLEIELKNLQEREKIVNEHMAIAAKLQERLSVLALNPDYRELRQLQGEVTRLEELCCESKSNLKRLTQDSQVDWTMIESLREECMEWAKVEEQVSSIKERINRRTEKINELEIDLESSGYQDLDEDADQRLFRAEEDRKSAQKELEQLMVIKLDIEKIREKASEERARLQEFAIMIGVTEVEEIKLAKKEQHLKNWRNSRIAGFLDRVGHNLGVNSIEDRLSFSLSQDYKVYNVSNYREFKNQLNNYREQRLRVEQVQSELARLQEILSREEKLHRIVSTRTKLLNQAFITTNTTDLAGWQNGWRNFQRIKQLRTIELEKLHSESDELKIQENLAANCAEQLREKIANWGTFAANRDEALAVVLKVARQLRIQEEAEKELSLFTGKLDDALDCRQIEQLAAILEPLAELEREIGFSDEERQARFDDINSEKLEIHSQKVSLEQRLRDSRKIISLSVLEKKIEKVKQKWLAYENLKNALQDVQTLLEVSWREWQTKYGEKLEREAEWVFSRVSLFSAQGTYFAYRMALAKLAFGNTIEVPLFFIVEETKEDQTLWKEILEYLYTLSDSRQVVLVTSDINLWQRVLTTDWQIISS
jgi:hypothetical protein